MFSSCIGCKTVQNLRTLCFHASAKSEYDDLVNVLSPEMHRKVASVIERAVYGRLQPKDSKLLKGSGCSEPLKELRVGGTVPVRLLFCEVGNTMLITFVTKKNQRKLAPHVLQTACRRCEDTERSHLPGNLECY